MKSNNRPLRTLWWGFIGFITVFTLIFVAYVPVKAEKKEPKPKDFLQFCVDTWGVTKTAECFKAQRVAVELLWEFKELESVIVDSTAYLCIDKNTYEKYNGVVDVVEAVACIVDVLEGAMKKKIFMNRPRI